MRSCQPRHRGKPAAFLFPTKPDPYPDWKNFKKRVPDSAVNQINDDPLGPELSAEYTAIRKGRLYHKIIFQLTKTPKPIQSDQPIKKSLDNGRIIQTTKNYGPPALLEAVTNRVARTK